MFIVDAQIHLWTKGEPIEPHCRGPYRMEDALRDMDAAGIAGALIHPPIWDQDGTTLGIQAARARPDRFAVMGWFDLAVTENRSLIEQWKDEPGIVGLRFTFFLPHQSSWLVDGSMDWLWPRAEKAGLPVGLATSSLLSVVGRIAERHPGLRLVVDHMGVNREGKDAKAFETLPQLLALARHPNVAVKATGGPGYVTDKYPFRSLQRYYRQIYDAFGPRRMFWGADKTRMPCSWRECISHFTEQSWLSQQDKELIMGRALCDWLNWPLPVRARLQLDA